MDEKPTSGSARAGRCSFNGAAVRYLHGDASGMESGPDIQLHFLPVGYLALPNGELGFAPYPSVTVLANVCHPESMGRVRLRSSAATDFPLIECRLLEDPRDVDTLLRGIDVVRAIMKTDPIASFIEEEVIPGSAVTTPQTLENFVRTHTTIAYHPVGTCRMGEDDLTVVGADLRVHGTSNLWVADASIMPLLISGNTNAACQMIGAKLGRELVARDSDSSYGFTKRLGALRRTGG